MHPTSSHVISHATYALAQIHNDMQYFNTFCAAPESDSKTPSYDTTKEVPDYFV